MRVDGPQRLQQVTRGLVAGHYLPLADNPGIAPEPDQT